MLKKILNTFVSDIYKIDILRTFIVLTRFFYFYYIRRRIKYYMDPNKKIDDHIAIKKDNKIQTVISYNMHFVEEITNLKKTYKKFSGSKTASLVFPLKAIDFVNYESDKILSVGPRNEGELFLIRSQGFLWKNIFAIDLITYSKLTKLGDIHQSEYSENFFDIIVCGWVLTYSNDFEKIIDELIRITKNKGLISIGFTYQPETEKVNIYDQNKKILKTTEQIINKYKNNIMSVYFNADAYTINPKDKRHSILIIRIKK